MRDWESYIAQEDMLEFLKSLAVQKTRDEFGEARYMVTDGITGDWIGESYSTPEEAFEKIDRLRKG